MINSEDEDATDALVFGRLVRERREAIGWSQEALAAAALSNSTRKGYISRIENGKVPNITRETVRSISRALEISRELIPLMLQWPTVVEKTDGPSNALLEIKRQQDELVASLRNQAREFGIKEGMLIALARRYAESTPEDFDAAFAGLERALEVARQEQQVSSQHSNYASGAEKVIAEIDRLNEVGDLAGGQRVLEVEIQRLDAEEKERNATRVRLYEKGVYQSILNRDVNMAANFTLSRLSLDAATGGRSFSTELQLVISDWIKRGAEKGLNFDLEVAVVLAKHGVDKASSPQDRIDFLLLLGSAQYELGEREDRPETLEAAVNTYELVAKSRESDCTDLNWIKSIIGIGLSNWRLGERENGTARLEAAVTNFRDAIAGINKWTYPQEWALANNGLGNVLSTIGWLDPSDRGNMLLKEALDSYILALDGRERVRLPLEWAATQNNIATTYWALSERSNPVEYLEAAIRAQRFALEEYQRDLVPLDWAMAQNNLGVMLQRLGKLSGDLALLNSAVLAFQSSSQERSRDRTPIDWAQTVGNEGETLCSIAELTSDLRVAESALKLLESSVSALEAADHGPYSEYYRNQVVVAQQLIAQLRGKN
jgi:transcriptional regulator with XRE-family HTH domain